MECSGKEKKRVRICNITPLSDLKSARLQLSPSPYTSLSTSSLMGSSSSMGGQRWRRMNPNGPRRPQARHCSRVGQSTSSCPGLLRRHLPHHVGTFSFCSNASSTVRLYCGTSIFSLLKRHLLDQCEWLPHQLHVFGPFRCRQRLHLWLGLSHCQQRLECGVSLRRGISRGPLGRSPRGASEGERVGPVIMRA